MKKQLMSFTLMLLAVMAFGAGSSNTGVTLSQSTGVPQTDGVFGDKEYSTATDLDAATVGLTWTADTLHIGVRAKTTGWVAVGIGSPRMNDATLFIGFVTGERAQLKIQKGSGHGHSDLDSVAMISYAMKEEGGRTTLELALKADGFIKKGQSGLDLIVAVGDSDTFTERHKSRGSLAVKLAR